MYTKCLFLSGYWLLKVLTWNGTPRLIFYAKYCFSSAQAVFEYFNVNENVFFNFSSLCETNMKDFISLKSNIIKSYVYHHHFFCLQILFLFFKLCRILYINLLIANAYYFICKEEPFNDISILNKMHCYTKIH